MNFNTDDEIRQLIRSIEVGSLKDSDWNHLAHLAMTAYYLTTYNEFEAILKIKYAIINFNISHNLQQSESSGYHETLTMFFIKLVQDFIKNSKEKLSLPKMVLELNYLYGDFKTIVSTHYKKNIINSASARKIYIPR